MTSRGAKGGRVARCGVRITLAWSALLMLAGCESQKPTAETTETPPGATPESVTGGTSTLTAPMLPPVTPPQAALSDLEARPLYTFTEAEVDQYLPHAWLAEPDLPQRVIHLARKNLGQPYDIYLLGEFPYEFYDTDPLYCLSKSDCLTFCEHMYAMALSRDWWTFLRTLQRLRYKDGTIGMLTRNHWTEVDWDGNNAYLFDDLTTKLGNGQVHVPLTNTVKRAAFFAKFGLGQDLPDEPVNSTYIPKDKVPGVLVELRAGDFVNIVRGDAQAQWVGHTGFIALAADGTVDFLHSAQPAVREQPLLDYLAHDRRCVGIKILRLRPDAEAQMATALQNPAATPVNADVINAKLAASPLMSTGAPDGYSEDWSRAMRLMSYRLDVDTPTDPAFQSLVEAAEQRIGDALGIPPEERAIGALDLTDLRLAMVRPDTMFYGASVPKICILLGYFDKYPEAARHLDPQVRSELERMIKRSDNEMAAKYSQLVGIEHIQALITGKQYRFYDQEHGGGLWCGKHYGLAEPRYGDPLHDHSHGATVRQCLRYYLLLEQGKLVSADACATMKEIFAAPALPFHDKDFVEGLKGRDATILRKSGWWEDWHLDTARVQHGQRLYLLAGMTKHPQGEAYLAQMATAIDDILCGQQPAPPYRHELAKYDGLGKLAVGPTGDAVFESPVLEPQLLFNEVVTSWNIATPEGAGFCVEVRIGRKEGDVWSPWLWTGDWGNVTALEPRTTQSEQAKIDVDYLVAPEQYDRVQYRVRGWAPEPTELALDRVAVCVSDTTGIPLSLPRPETPLDVPTAQWQRTLDVPHHNQRTSRPEMKGKLCSPTSVSMLLAYNGIEETPEQVALRTFDPATNIYGAWPRNVQTAYSYGVRGYLTRISDWNEVKRFIAAGQPLIISIRVYKPDVLTGAPYHPSGGHLIVLTGFDADGNITVNDPAIVDPHEGRRTYLRTDMEKYWLRGSGGLTYVLEGR